MGVNKDNFKQDISKMFVDGEGLCSDEELALHIIHRFNICRDTLETMPAFNEHIQPLFSKEKIK